MPEEQIKALEEYRLMNWKFRGEEEPEEGDVVDRSSMEIRAMALVLSGAIPPTIYLDDTMSTVQGLLEDPAGLLPRKALMTG